MRISMTFDVIRDRVQIKGVCKSCGKRRSRTLTEEMMENSYNKNPDGTVRNRQQIYEAVAKKLAERRKKVEKDFICATCYGNLGFDERTKQVY